MVFFPSARSSKDVQVLAYQPKRLPAWPFRPFPLPACRGACDGGLEPLRFHKAQLGFKGPLMRRVSEAELPLGNGSWDFKHVGKGFMVLQRFGWHRLGFFHEAFASRLFSALQRGRYSNQATKPSGAVSFQVPFSGRS